jgi:hypothetical protein
VTRSAMLFDNTASLEGRVRRQLRKVQFEQKFQQREIERILSLLLNAVHTDVFFRSAR